jgi:hypothetical protein
MQNLDLPPHTSNPFTSKLVSAHQFQQRSNDCGPFSAAILINGICGLELSGQDLAASMNKVHWNGILPHISRIQNWATFPWGVAAALKDYGIPSAWRVLVRPARLSAILRDGLYTIVIIGGWKKPIWAHYKILVDENDVCYGFVDPAYPDKEVRWQSKDDFYARWNAMGRMLIEIKSLRPVAHNPVLPPS